jgi:L-asparaginase II
VKLAAVRYRVEVRRGSGLALEATHHVTVIGWDQGSEQSQKSSSGSIVPEHDWNTCIRSGSKPLQALPLVERGHADRFGLSAPELAIICASHSGSREHVETVRGVLRKIGAREEDLLCGFHHPYDREMSSFTHSHPEENSPVYNNCSGKHAGMLALAVAEGWPISDYVEPV